MKTVFVLQHSCESDSCDETKFIGVYSSKEEANKAVLRLKAKQGFENYPDSFHINEYELDKDHWTEGFATMTSIHVKKKDNSWTVVQAKCLPNNTYQIIELYENDMLGPFKHLDIVECESKDDELYAVRRANKNC